MRKHPLIAVVIPCYRVKKSILAVLERIGAEVSLIYVVDDKCPERSGDFVKEHTVDDRVRVIHNPTNLGVGGAVKNGYVHAIRDGAQVIVKVDGDGQMDPRLIPKFVSPILSGEADYTKGNRFWSLSHLQSMPKLRLFGNSTLSFVNKLVSGYWSIMDPTNGYTAIHATAASLLPLDKIEDRYFFESDMLFRLSTIRALVRDIPMRAVYSDEESGLEISKIAVSWPSKFCSRFCKRIFYNYFLKDFGLGSLALLASLPLTGFGLLFGGYHWMHSIAHNSSAPTGTIMLAVLPLILGIQFLLFFLQVDITSMPNSCLHKSL